MPRKKVLILGDSTIDNRVWLGKEKYHLYARVLPYGRRFLDKIIDFVDGFNSVKPKSVVEHLCAQMPEVEFIDRTNDGFTAKDVLNGQYRDKVFGRGAHRFFPAEIFKPLDTKEIEEADQIILSVGGNDFREFIQQAMRFTNKQRRSDFISSRYSHVFKKMVSDYQAILKQIIQRNPNACIILMTQYYPALYQNTLLGHNIYDFMRELGVILNKGNAQDTIVEVMKDSYSEILQFIANDESFQNVNVSVVDVTSSLNPHFSENYVGQIEPSDKGGKSISQMLSYVIAKSQDNKKQIYRFSPGFFDGDDAGKESCVHVSPIKAKTTFTPVHPSVMQQPKYRWNQNRVAIASAFTLSVIATFSGASIFVIFLTAIAGGIIGYTATNRLARYPDRPNNDEAYRFEIKTDESEITSFEDEERKSFIINHSQNQSPIKLKKVEDTAVFKEKNKSRNSL